MLFYAQRSFGQLRSFSCILVIFMFPLLAGAQLTLSSQAANFQFTLPTMQTAAFLFPLQHTFSTTENSSSKRLSRSLLWKLPPPLTTTEQPKAYCFKTLALFCKIEVQLEEMSRIPVKFRLGSVDYVDQLESKR